MQLFNQSCFIVFLRLTHPQSSSRLRATLPCFPPSHHIPCPRTGERHREMTGDESVPKVMLWGISEWKNFTPMQRLVFFKNMEVGHPYCKIKCRKPNWFMKGEERRPPPPPHKIPEPSSNRFYVLTLKTHILLITKFLKVTNIISQLPKSQL